MRLTVAQSLLLVGCCAVLVSAASQPSAQPARVTASSKREAAPPVADVSRIGIPSFKLTNDHDGLPQNSVKAIAIDHHGYLWVGTQDGAAFFNGRRWQIVNMPDGATSNWITTIHVASDGSLLFGTNGGGVHRLTDGAWIDLEAPAPATPIRFVSAIADVPGTDGSTSLWIATDDGIHALENGTWTRYGKSTGLPADDFTSLITTKDAAGAVTVWAGSEAGVLRYTSGRWITDGAAAGLPDPYVYCLAQGRDSNGMPTMWAGTDAGVAMLRNGPWEAVDLPGEQSRPAVYSLLYSQRSSSSSVLWVGSAAGLAKFDGHAWISYDRSSGLPDNSIISLFELTSGQGVPSLLVGTLSGGLARLSEGCWLAFDSRNGLPDDHVYGFLETRSDSGRPVYWIATYGGLARLEDGRWTVYRSGSGLPSDKVNCLLETRSPTGARILWVGTQGGLSRLEAGRWSVFDTRSGLPNNFVRCLLETESPSGARTLWVGTYGGIARLEDGAWTVVNTSSGLPNNQVMALAATSSKTGGSTVWAGTLGGGLARYREGAWSTIDRSSGLPNDFVRSLREVDTPGVKRELWVGTLDGVAWLDLEREDGGWGILTDATEPALPNSVIYGICRDSAGFVYLSTNWGVARLSRSSPTAASTTGFELYNFNTEDGLPSNECNGGAMMVDSDGRIWVGTVDGAGLYDPKAATTPRTAGPLRIERTLVHGVTLAGSSMEAPVGKDGAPDAVGPSAGSIAGRTLDHDANDIVFEFALLSYFKESETRYRTQLVGFDEEPSAWTAEPTRTYTRLPEGDFTFRVWGRDFAGNVAGPVDVAFAIRPAPWRTLWAYAIYAIALAALGYAVLRIRVRHFERRNRELEERIAERTSELDGKNRALSEAFEKLVESEHQAKQANRAKSVFLANMSHELRTPLNAILGFVQLMQRRRASADTEREYLDIITRSGQHLLGLINDVLSVAKIESGKITLSESNFELDLLIRNVREMFAARAVDKGIELVFEIDPSCTRHVVGDEGKLRQVLINLIGNAVKFTDRGRVTVRMGWTDGLASVEVEDTGQGIAPDELDRLFEPFVQTESGRRSTEGTGLGLTISRDIVRLMGGDITVESELGAGSSFRFSIALPEVDPGAYAARPEVIGLASGSRGSRILVVDDREENRRLLTELLGPLGFEVREAADGEDALRQLADWPADVILIDVRMPVMDGYEATRRIRDSERESGHASRAAIIALSASVFEHDRASILDAGCDAFLPKPVVTADLFEAIERHSSVVFEYATTVESGDVRESHLSVDRIAALSAEVRNRLARALQDGDMQRATDVVGEIGGVDESLASALGGMVRGYRVDEILALLESAREVT